MLLLISLILWTKIFVNCQTTLKPAKNGSMATLIPFSLQKYQDPYIFREIYYHLMPRSLFLFIIVSTYLMFGGLLQGLGNPGGNGEQNQEAPKEIDWLLVDKAVEKLIKFNTEDETFDRTYPKVDHLQRYFNEKAVNHFVEAITKKYEQEQKPLSILDVCCGYGLPTTTIRERLLQNGVNIERIVGYDVSEDMINFDKHNNHLQPKVHFEKVNIETQLKDVEQYDVAFCLFGLHWMNDLEGAVFRIARSLKKGGLFLSLTPIEIKDLFDYRQNFVEYSKWSTAIAQNMRILHPFHYNKQDYLSVLEKHFVTVYEQKKQTKFNYNRKEYLTFLQSWLQEVRHLTNDVNHELKKEAVAQAYISDFIDSIDKNLHGNIIIHENGSIVYTQHTYDYDGVKK